MTIEQKLEILKRAMEKGANVSLSIHGVESEKNARLISDKFSELDFNDASHTGSHWLGHASDGYRFKFAIHYKKSKEDRRQELLAELEELERVE